MIDKCYYEVLDDLVNKINLGESFEINPIDVDGFNLNSAMEAEFNQNMKAISRGFKRDYNDVYGNSFSFENYLKYILDFAICVEFSIEKKGESFVILIKK